jgi:carbon monoxide dehydrogenase subunit G
MQLSNVFEVPASPEEVWRFLLDVERVAPCVPGAELTEVVDERTWKGKVVVKLGAVSLSYAGTVAIQERDDAARRVVLVANGTETRGRGVARATATSRLEPTDSGTRVVIDTELSLSGPVAQYGRGMIADVSRRLTDEFAACLRARLEAPEAPVRQARPVGGIRLALWALLRAIGRLLGRARRALGGRAPTGR